VGAGGAGRCGPLAQGILAAAPPLPFFAASAADGGAAPAQSAAALERAGALDVKPGGPMRDALATAEDAVGAGGAVLAVGSVAGARIAAGA